MIGPVRAEESRASPGRQFPLRGGGRWAWERSLEPLSHLEGWRARDDLVRGDEGPHPRWMIGPVRAEVWNHLGWRCGAWQGNPVRVLEGKQEVLRAPHLRPFRLRSPPCLLPGLFTVVSSRSPPDWRLLSRVFPEGGRGRGARAGGRYLGGNARSTGWNASRGTAARRSFRPPSPQSDPESSVRVGGSEVSWSRGLLPIFLDGRHTGGRPSACTNPTSAPEGRGWQDAD